MRVPDWMTTLKAFKVQLSMKGSKLIAIRISHVFNLYPRPPPTTFLSNHDTSTSLAKDASRGLACWDKT